MRFRWRARPMSTQDYDPVDKYNAKQELAEPGRYYGDGGTIHHTGFLDVETLDGDVVAVWFRCLPLPFRQVEVNTHRAADMDEMYESFSTRLTGVEVLD